MAEKRLLRIGFTGASGTGKTSLVNALISEFSELEVSPVGSRSVAREMGFEYPYDVDKASYDEYIVALEAGMNAPTAARQAMHKFELCGGKTVRAEFQLKLQRDKIAWETAHEKFVVDRTTIDDFVYTAIHAPMTIDENFINRAKAHVLQYDVVFLTPMDVVFNLNRDPARLQDYGYHAAFETLAFALAHQWLWPSKLVYVEYSEQHRRKAYVIDHVRDILN